MNRRYLYFLLGAFISVFLASMLTGCGGKKTVKIGVFEPLSGDHAVNGYAEKEGILLAHSLRNAVDGKEVELIDADNESSTKVAATVAEKLAKTEKVNAVIGSWGSTLSIAAAPLFEEEKIVAMAASCTDPLVTLDREWYFRMCFIDAFQARALARFTVERLGSKSVAIITEKDDRYSTSLAKYYSEALMEMTGNPHIIIADESYASDAQDFNTLITSVSRKEPDLIFAPGNGRKSAILIQQARKLGVSTQFLGGDTWVSNDFLNTGGAEINGVIMSSFFDVNAAITPKTQEFVKAYRDKYGKDPADITALSFDAYNMLIDAMEIAGTKDSNKLRETLASMKNWEGVMGHYSFDENGDPIKDVVFKTVNNGQFVFLESLSNYIAKESVLQK